MTQMTVGFSAEDLRDPEGEHARVLWSVSHFQMLAHFPRAVTNITWKWSASLFYLRMCPTVGEYGLVIFYFYIGLKVP